MYSSSTSKHDDSFNDNNEKDIVIPIPKKTSDSSRPITDSTPGGNSLEEQHNNYLAGRN